jgi:hypothetical protein
MFWTILLAFVALFWIVTGLLLARGVARLPKLSAAEPLPDGKCPRVSIIFSARDEEEKLPRALEAMLALNYPDFEIIAVNDRSSDRTGSILDAAAQRDPRLKVVHIRELPRGWLGKPHGLQRGFEASTGEWLIFTDGDVRFAPDLLRRSLGVAQKNGWDHLTLLGRLELEGFWEKSVITYFAMGFTARFRPWRVSDAKSSAFMGVGTFQLVRREAYERSGTHRKLAMEVIDDMKLGKIIKQAGARSGVGLAEDSVVVRWHAGIGNIIRGVEKNFFAGANYSLLQAGAQLLSIVLMSMLPFAGVFVLDGWARVFAAAAALTSAAIHGATAHNAKASWLYGLAHPLAALVFAYMLVRSTALTLWQGGIVWRGTFYRLDELRKGVV